MYVWEFSQGLVATATDPDLITNHDRCQDDSGVPGLYDDSCEMFQDPA